MTDEPSSHDLPPLWPADAIPPSSVAPATGFWTATPTAPPSSLPPDVAGPPPSSAPPSAPLPSRARRRPTTPPSRATSGPMSDTDQRQWAAFAHAGAILGPIGWVPALALYLGLGDRGPFLADQAKEALNFNLTATAVLLGVTIVTVALQLIGVDVLPSYWVWLVQFGLGCHGAYVASTGRPHRYQVTARPLA